MQELYNRFFFFREKEGETIENANKPK